MPLGERNSALSSYSRIVNLYDTLYSDIKDYEGEAAQLTEILRSSPHLVRRVLDVGCGTGLHARALAGSGFEVDGLDLEPGFVEIAQKRNPDGEFAIGDMTAFDVDQAYDAVLCLFSSIGYAMTESGLQSALGCFAQAVRPGGFVIVEPWFEPGFLTDGHISMLTVETEGAKVCRMSRTDVDGPISRIEFDYLIARRDGIEHIHQVHELGLFSQSQLEEAFGSAGLEVEHDAEGLIGRGMYVGRKPSDF